MQTLTKSADFDEAYNALRAELGNDPRYKAAQSRIGDLLPLAVEGLYSILSSLRTPHRRFLLAAYRLATISNNNIICNNIDVPLLEIFTRPN